MMLEDRGSGGCMSFVHVAVSNMARILFVKVVVVVLIKNTTPLHYIQYSAMYAASMFVRLFVCLAYLSVGCLMNDCWLHLLVGRFDTVF